MSLLYCLLFEKEAAEEGRRPPCPPGPSEPAWLPRMPASIRGRSDRATSVPNPCSPALRHYMTHGGVLCSTLGMPFTCS